MSQAVVTLETGLSRQKPPVETNACCVTSLLYVIGVLESHGRLIGACREVGSQIERECTLVGGHQLVSRFAKSRSPFLPPLLIFFAGIVDVSTSWQRLRAYENEIHFLLGHHNTQMDAYSSLGSSSLTPTSTGT